MGQHDRGAAHARAMETTDESQLVDTLLTPQSANRALCELRGCIRSGVAGVDRLGTKWPPVCTPPRLLPWDPTVGASPGCQRCGAGGCRVQHTGADRNGTERASQRPVDRHANGCHTDQNIAGGSKAPAGNPTTDALSRRAIACPLRHSPQPFAEDRPAKSALLAMRTLKAPN